MSVSPEVLATVQSLVQQYGEDAPVIAVLKAAEFAAMGDAETLAHWDLVIAYLDPENGPPEGVAQ